MFPDITVIYYFNNINWELIGRKSDPQNITYFINGIISDKSNNEIWKFRQTSWALSATLTVQAITNEVFRKPIIYCFSIVYLFLCYHFYHVLYDFYTHYRLYIRLLKILCTVYFCMFIVWLDEFIICTSPIHTIYKTFFLRYYYSLHCISFLDSFSVLVIILQYIKIMLIMLEFEFTLR